MRKSFGPPKNPKAYLVALLARREYSEAELREKLRQREVDSAAIDESIAFVKAQGFQSDQRYAESRSRSLAGRKGDAVIRRELQRKGVRQTDIESAMPELPSELVRARQAAERFRGALIDVKSRARAWRFLASRGFSSATVKKVLKELGENCLDADFDTEE